MGVIRKMPSGAIPRLENHVYYEIFKHYRGQGYGKLLLELLIKKAFFKGLKQVIILVDQENLASFKIIDSLPSSRKEIVSVGQKQYLRIFLLNQTLIKG